LQKRLLNFLAVDERAIGGPQITQKTARGCDLQHAVISRKETIIGQAKMSRVAAPNQECIVAIEREDTTGVRPGEYS
jgi:hypothetical protein